MGFLQAVHSLGEMVSKKNQDSPLADIMNYLQLPYSLEETEDRAVHVIRIWLEAIDCYSEVLEIRGISHIDKIEYAAIGKEMQIRERCLYREPVGRNVSWRFSPIYKLGKASKDVNKSLLGGGWQTDNKSVFYKLYNNVLNDYEKLGYFSEGSVDRIISSLNELVDKVAEYWNDSKRPYLLIFGVKKENIFLYPGELPVFVKYFRNKLKPDSAEVTKTKGDHQREIYCALCGERSHEVKTLDKVFKFATFDKPGFLPGAKDGVGVKEKVFPICEKCYGTLSAGREEMDNRFINYEARLGVNLYVIPEIVFNKFQYYRMATDFTKDFLTKGIKHEPFLFNNLARHQEGLVYHFLFAEPNQAQLIVHSLIEDVPPTRLKRLEELWTETCFVFGYDDDSENKGRLSLDTSFRQIIAVMLSLAGKAEQDKTVMREKIITTISALLNGEQVRTNDIKTLMVSRLTGLFNDSDWIRPKEKDKLPGRLQMKGMAQVIDFLIRANRREK